jgi:hypothetical protein
VLDSDSGAFGGFDRVDSALVYETNLGDNQLRLYLPSRTALVLKKL